MIKWDKEGQLFFDFDVEELDLKELIDLRMMFFKVSTNLLAMIVKESEGNLREKLLIKKNMYDSIVDYLGILIAEKEGKNDE